MAGSAMADVLPAEIKVTLEGVAPDMDAEEAEDLEMSSEQDIVRWVCKNTRFVCAELWSFGNGSAGLDASVSASTKDKSLHKVAPNGISGMKRSGSMSQMSNLGGMMAALTRTNTGESHTESDK